MWEEGGAFCEPVHVRVSASAGAPQAPYGGLHARHDGFSARWERLLTIERPNLTLYLRLDKRA